MKTNGPRFVTWIIAVVLLAIGLIATVAGSSLPVVIENNAFWFAFVGGALLAVANIVKGL